MRKFGVSDIQQHLRLLRAERSRVESILESLRDSATKAVINDAEIVISTLGSSGSQVVEFIYSQKKNSDFFSHFIKKKLLFFTILIL